jgi:hypothetical protein
MMTNNPDGKRFEISDRERKAKTQYTDRLPKSQTELTDQEDTVRNIQDKPNPPGRPGPIQPGTEETDQA